MSNEIEIKVFGLNLSKLINRLVENNVFVGGLSVGKKSSKFFVYEKDFKKFQKICRLERKYYVVLKRKGLRSWVANLPYCFGAFLSVVISGCYMFSFHSVIHNVNLTYSSNFGYDTKNVQKVMNQNGIVSGMKKSTFEPSEIEKIILSSCEDIAGCSVKISGGNLDICVFPSTPKYEINTADLCSNYDAVITKANASVGDLVVKVGDVVRVGQVLIKNNNGASGKISGKVYFVGSVLFNESQKYYEKTGRKTTKTDIVIFNKKLTKSKNNTIFTNYLEEKCDFQLTKLFLPIKKRVTTYYETVVKEKVVLFDDVEDEIKKQAYQLAIKKIPEGQVVKNVTYSIVRDGLLVKVDCYLEVEMSLI